ncbi:hypothetical protein ASG52_19765 [Methylobacterium sp. Leaf456]|uniref:hypothetical protein n=1 Tax=Methylobacterium sp. Leaf456 TaxID=1736382 RepID=UPI0006F90F29|nr:hypothetical protein [Methylobacterium sp. Leaf456]KQT59965.1 hypothetical protein ASG52_19765 [Methylobacterium sp. Leaf456]
MAAARLAHLPLPATFGQRPDGTTWISFGDPAKGQHMQIDGPLSAKAAADICRAVNAFGPAGAGLEAVRSSYRDPDAHCVLPNAACESVEVALAAMGSRS